MIKERIVFSAKTQKILHFHQILQLPQQATLVPYKSQHTTTSKIAKKSKNKFQEFTYYRFAQDKNKIMKILYIDEEKYMLIGYYPFTEILNDISNVSELNSKYLFKVVKAQAAYIGHYKDEIVVKKLIEVKFGQNKKQFDTIGDNFQILKIQNKERFQQFQKQVKNDPKALQQTIRVIIDETDIQHPIIIDYQYFKKQLQVKDQRLKIIDIK